ncbi:MAG TPA: site-specific DNA-methyltransferase [bacterium]|nr:site-specific DNA-methyltransferase [bacterium]
MTNRNTFYNQDCIQGCEKNIPDSSVDLIITDPPYGIRGDQLHKHYNRDEGYVLDGYIEIPESEYGEFSRQWINQAERILKPGGAAYILSGYTNLFHILAALRNTHLQEVNHIIWKYNFGVYTRKKFVSSHYHILHYVKPGAPRTFNTYCRYGPQEKDNEGGSRNYQDREDVWWINKEYKPGQRKNKNELPLELLQKIILYSSNEGDLVCDLFLGSFSTARAAIGLGRYATGFEKSGEVYEHHAEEIRQVEFGEMLADLRRPEVQLPENQGKPWSAEEKQLLRSRFQDLANRENSKQEIITALMGEFGRGKFSIQKMLKHLEI